MARVLHSHGITAQDIHVLVKTALVLEAPAGEKIKRAAMFGD
jgi:hypothetical protein